MQKTYEIWVEGFNEADKMQTAKLLGKYAADSFKEAVNGLVEDTGLNIKITKDSGMLLWGCRLFDNEKNARKAFG